MKTGMTLLLVCCVACGSANGSAQATSDDGGSSPQLMAGFDPGPAPANGYQIVMPIVSGIQPLADLEYCTWSDIVLDHDIDVKSAQGIQSKGGHHTVLYYTTTKQPPGTTRICTDDDMTTFRFAVGAGGEGSGQTATLPGDLAVHIPAGAQLVVNHHYLNASSQSIDQAQSAMNVYLADPGAKVTRSSSVAVFDTSMSVPPGAGSVDVTCTMNNDYATWMLVPHAHQWATHVTVDEISGTNSKRLFDVDWDPSYQFHPPTMTSDPSQPYVLHKGDQIHAHCTYNNTTSKPLTFGPEMCVVFAQDVDAADVGSMQCDKGVWGAF